MNEQIKINWYRCKVDKKLMSELMRPSDFRALCQIIPQLGLYLITGTLMYLAFANIHATNWTWAVPVLLVMWFVHGTFSAFLGFAGAGHELTHKTPFRTKALNEFFLKVYSFLSWSDYVSFRPSHVKHHQVTVHKGHDGEVVLPQTLNWQSVKFFLTAFICNPYWIFTLIRIWVRASRGNIQDMGEWLNQIMPESNATLRRDDRRWSQMVVYGHLALALAFILTGHWFLIFVFNIGCLYCPWLVLLVSTPQHIGMSPDVPDFRLCCRTYTCSRLPAFFYWNMQYHVEHHMFPAVPFYHLPRLRAAIELDLPPAPHGLWATWKELLAVLKKQKEDPNYVFIPKLPPGDGERAVSGSLEIEAAGQAA